jgi:hypothetical protein
MTINQQDQKRIKLICNHEAGHYIVGRELSFKTHGITIVVQPFQGHSATAVIEPWTPNIDELEKLREYLERRIQVLYAGAISEAMDEIGNYNSEYALKEWRTGGAMNDHAKIRELVQTLRNINYPSTIDQPNAQKELDFLDLDLIRKAGAIISTRLNFIQGISEMLFQKVKLYNTQYELNEDEINSIPNIRKLYIDKEEI